MRSTDKKNKIQDYLKEHKMQKQWKIVTAILALLAMIITSFVMILPALTLETDPVMLECQLDVHEHTPECYDNEGNIICGYADFIVHTHDESCFDDEGKLICPLEEIKEHKHSESCYKEDKVQICGLEESEGHVHDESCYKRETEPSCGKEEAEGHTHNGHIHTDECYEEVSTLICGLEECEPHAHDTECYDENGVLICTQITDGHVHTDECYSIEKKLICTKDTGCYDVNGNLVCTKSIEGHKHTEDCYRLKLVCGKNEVPAHHHTEDCYEIRKVIICGKEEVILHTHGDTCYDASGNLICGMLETKEHVHDELCFPEKETEKPVSEIANNPVATEETEETVKPEVISEMEEINENPVDENTEANTVASPGNTSVTVEKISEQISSNKARKSFVNSISLQAANSGIIDLTNYISSLNINVLQDGYWVPIKDSSVYSGDSIQVVINFTIDADVITENNRQVTYQLPKGISLGEDAGGTVYDGVSQVGTYTISQDGLIIIIFDESYADGRALGGNVTFQGVVTASGEEGDQTIDFGFSGGTINVRPVETIYDLTVSKNGWYETTVPAGSIQGINIDTLAIGYEVVISSKSGTNNELVTLRDTITSNNAIYYFGTVPEENGGTLYSPTLILNIPGNDSIFAGGEEEIENTTDALVQLNNDISFANSSSFSISNLPALGQGGSYSIYYYVLTSKNLAEADGKLVVENTAIATAGELEGSAKDEVWLNSDTILKYGEYNQANGKITWTVMIRNFDGQPIVVNDSMVWIDANGTEHPYDIGEVTADIEIRDSQNAVKQLLSNQQIKFPYTIDCDQGDYVVITYETGLPEDAPTGQQVTIRNKAGYLDFETGADVEVGIPGEYFMYKECMTQMSLTMDPLKWHSQVTYPAGTYQAGDWPWSQETYISYPDRLSLSYMDLLVDVATSDTNIIQDSHYTTASDLKSNLNVSVGNTPLVEGDDYEVYVLTRDNLIKITGGAPGTLGEYLSSYEVTLQDFFKDTGGMNNWQLIDDVNSSDHLVAFLIILNPSSGDILSDEAMKTSTLDKMRNEGWAPIDINYQTRVSSEKLNLNAANRAYNFGKIPANNAVAWAQSSQSKALLKQVSKTGAIWVENNTYDTSSYTDQQVSINTGEDGQLVYYRILLSGISGRSIEVVDILPVGMELVDGTVILAEHGTSYDITTSNTSDPSMISYRKEPQDDGTTKVTFTVILSNQDLAGVPLGIYYTVSVENDPELTDGESKIYENVASWDGLSDNTSTTVTHTERVLYKAGQHIEDTNRLQYGIIVNPEGRKLHPDNSVHEITLEDTLQNVPNGVTVTFPAESVNVYYFDRNNPDGFYCGEEMETTRYSYEVDAETNTILFTLPDEQPCVVVYEYEVNRGNVAGTISIYNQASLAGKAAITSGDSVEIEETTSSAEVNKASLRIYKRDAVNPAELLSGAHFKLERYEEVAEGGRNWRISSLTTPDGADGDDYVTNTDGYIELSFVEYLENGSLYNTLYRLQETKAPDGYIASPLSYYFIWMEKGATRESTIEKMRQNGAFPQDFNPTDESLYIQFIPYSTSVTAYVNNEPNTTQIAVTKRWQDYDGDSKTSGIPESVEVYLQYRVGENGEFTDCDADNALDQVRLENAKVMLDDNNHWYYVWKNLPKKTDDGTTIYYRVKEKVVPDGYKVTYDYGEGGSETTGITSGDIIVVNKEKSSFELPETGGVGKFGLMIVGLIMIGTSLIGYEYWKRNMGGGHIV